MQGTSHPRIWADQRKSQNHPLEGDPDSTLSYAVSQSGAIGGPIPV